MSRTTRRVNRLLKKAGRYQDLYLLTGRVSDLYKGIAACDELAAMDLGDYQTATAHVIASTMLVQLSERHHGDTAMLDAVLERCGRAEELIDPDGFLSADVEKNRADTLMMRYGLLGAEVDIDAAVRSARRAVAIVRNPLPEDREMMAALGETMTIPHRITLSACLMQRSTVGQTSQGVDELVHLCWEIVGERGLLSGAMRAKALGNLSTALRLQYQRDADSAVLDQAIAVAESALSENGVGGPSIVVFHRDLGWLHMLRFRRTAARRDLDAAIPHLAAIQRAEGRIATAPMWSELGLALLNRAALDRSDADFAAAMRAYASAVRLSNPGWERAVSLANTGFAHLRWAWERMVIDGYRTIEYYQGIATACACYEAAAAEHVGAGTVPAPLTLIGFVRCLVELASAPPDLAADVPVSGGEREQALQLCRTTLAEDEADRPLEVSVHLRSLAAQAHAVGGEWGPAVDLYEQALADLRELGAVGIQWSDISHRLAFITPFTSDAVICAIKLGDLDRAVRLLEMGRGVIVSNARQFRADLARLEADLPGLASEVRALQPHGAVGSDASLQAPLVEATTVSSVRGVLTRIRTHAGFETFGRVDRDRDFDFDTLRGLGHTVALATSQHGSAILVATTDGLRAAELSSVEYLDVIEHLARFVEAIALFDAGAADQELIHVEVSAFLEWGWVTFGRPALEMCGVANGPLAVDPWPRVRWCLLGPLASMPVHAFGLAGVPDASVLDRVVSSYSTSVIPHYDRRPDLIVDPSVTAVVADAAPGHEPLPKAATEAAELQRIHPRTVVLDGARATADRVLQSLATTDVVHFACHGLLAVEGGDLPALLLYDRSLGTDEIAQQIEGRGRLAYASACSTAAGQLAVADEMLSVGAGLQAAGFDHVISTLWTINDALGPVVARSFYHRLTDDGGVFAVNRSAEALHSAVRDLRARVGDRPVHWAGYVHYTR